MIEERLRVCIPNSEEQKTKLNNFLKGFNNISSELNIVSNRKTIDDNVKKIQEYSNTTKTKLINGKKDHLDNLSKVVRETEEDLKSDYSKLNSMKSEIQNQKESFNNERAIKLTYFNKINQYRKESNEIEENQLREYSAMNHEIKLIYKELLLVLRLIKSRIINFKELSEGKESKYIGYFLNPDKYNFKLFEISLDMDKHKLLEYYWSELVSILKEKKSIDE